MVAVVEKVERFEDTFELNLFTKLERLACSEIKCEKFVIEPQGVSLDDVRERAAVYDRGRLCGADLNDRRQIDLVRQQERRKRVEPVTLMSTP